MLCPVCETDNLYRAEREGIEIDVCTHCDGVWLDQGELDTIIHRAVCDDPAVAKPNTAQAADRFARFRRTYDRYFTRFNP